MQVLVRKVVSVSDFSDSDMERIRLFVHHHIFCLPYSEAARAEQRQRYILLRHSN